MGGISVNRPPVHSACRFALLVVGFAAQGLAQDVLTVALADLSRYFGAAARLVSSAITGLQNVEAAQVPQEQRSNAVDQLRTISYSISNLRVSQGPLIEDLTEYATAVRQHGSASEADVQEWRRIVISMKRVSNIVGNTLTIVEESAWLNATLSAEDRLALREGLLARVGLLDRLLNLPAPSRPEEIGQLERMNQYYRRLFDSLGQLNAAVTHAADQLKVK
jgi:hypothetical protein